MLYFQTKSIQTGIGNLQSAYIYIAHPSR